MHFGLTFLYVKKFVSVKVDLYLRHYDYFKFRFALKSDFLIVHSFQTRFKSIGQWKCLFKCKNNDLNKVFSSLIIDQIVHLFLF